MIAIKNFIRCLLGEKLVKIDKNLITDACG